MRTILEIKNYSFSYPGADKKTISDINLEIKEGTFNVLCGRSGCGKSTLLRQLKSVIACYGNKEGEIYYCGRPLDQVSERVQSEEIGFVLQNPDNQIVTDKVWHELAFGLESLGYSNEVIRLRVSEMASYFGIQNWFMKNVSELSGGQKQLLNLASIMSMHPRLLILDEPTSQLDPIAASDFLETVRKICRDVGTTVLITEHRLQDVIPYADKVVVMDKGRIFAEGRPEEIGHQLKQSSHDMFLSMPIPMQIYAGVDNDLPCPLTVSQGRRWMEALLGVDADWDAIWKQKETGNKGGKTFADKADQVPASGISKMFHVKQKTLPAIEAKELWFRYEKEGKDVIKGLSFQVEAGSFYAIVGGNGTGKSTTLSLLSRVRKPYRGSIRLFGKDIGKFTDQELYRDCIGVLPQNPQSMFLKKTVKEDLYSMIGGPKEVKSKDYQADMKKTEAIEGIVKLTNLEGLLDRHPYDLSGGEQQRLALAKVLLLRPRILLMDEPTKGLDAGYKKEFGDIIKKLQERGITIFMISHDVEFVAEYADQVGLFFEGSIATSREARAFFAGNSFYTTAANRMAREYFPEAVTGKDVIACLKARL